LKIPNSFSVFLSFFFGSQQLLGEPMYTASLALQTPVTGTYINESKVLKMLIASYVQPNNCLKTTSESSAIKVATMKITTMNGSHHVPTTKLTLFAISSKDKWDKRSLVSP